MDKNFGQFKGFWTIPAGTTEENMPVRFMKHDPTTNIFRVSQTHAHAHAHAHANNYCPSYRMRVFTFATSMSYNLLTAALIFGLVARVSHTNTKVLLSSIFFMADSVVKGYLIIAN